MTRRMQASEESSPRDLEPEPAEVQPHKHRRAVRVVKVLALGGVVALVTKDDLRSRLLDALFGPEEAFEYDSVTEPVAPGLHPEGAGAFRPAGAEALMEDAEGPDEELWSIPAPEAEAPVSIVNDPPPSSDESRFPAAHPVDPETEDSLAADRETPVSSFSGAARSYDAPAPAYDADAPAYEPPAYEPPASPYEPPASSYQPAAPADDAPPSADVEGPAWAGSAPAPPPEDAVPSGHEPPASPASDAPASVAPAYGAPAETDGSPAPAYEAPASGEKPAASGEAAAAADEVRSPAHSPGGLEDAAQPFEPAAEPPATGTVGRSYEAPSYAAPSYEAPSYEAPSYEAPSEEPATDAYPVYEPIPGALEVPEPTAAFDASPAGVEDAPRTEAGAAEPPAPAGVAEAALHASEPETAAEPPEHAEPPEPLALDEPATPLAETLAEPSAETSAPLAPEAPTAEADTPAAEADTPAIGEADPGQTAPRRSAWWVPRRRRASSTPEPPRWE